MSQTVKVHLRGHLVWHVRQRECLQVEVCSPVTAGEVVEMAGVPLSEVGVIRRNGDRIDLNGLIRAGDVLEIMPVIAGG